ncbi:MAG: lysine--tRNA ligase, partial [Pseudobdellovibrionaceae bacterium]
MIEEQLDESEVYQVRKQKLVELREQGFNFPNQFHREHYAADITRDYESSSKEELAEKKVKVS